MSQEKVDTLSIEQSTIADDISNFIDENQVQDMLDASEIDNKISLGQVIEESTKN